MFCSIGCAVHMRGVTSSGSGDHTSLVVNNLEVGWSTATPTGYGIVTLNMTGSGCRVASFHKFYLDSSESQAQQIADWMASLPAGTVFAGVTYRYPGFNKKNILMPEFHKVGIKIEKITAGGAMAFVAKKGDPSFAKYHMVSNNNKLKYVDLYHYMRSFYTGKYNKFRVNDIMGKIWTYYNRLCVDLTYNDIKLYSYPQFKYNTKQSWVRFLCL